ncbi:spore coat protein [Paenibacillus tarimensis]|uniref:spore coat protein n=1 Tax=Paenibacillus tarimensis TaxID=416012 RepID=UPI002E24845D
MNNDYLDPINSLHMPELADTTLAMDLLMRAKEAVRNTAIAITEAATPELRLALRNQLRQELAMHKEVTELMVRKRWFHPYELSEQYKLDMLAANNTVKISGMNLYREDSSRKGMFYDTPDQHIGGEQA